MYDQQWLRPACAYAQSDQSLCQSLEYSRSVKLLAEHHLKFLRLKGGWAAQARLSLHLLNCQIVHVVGAHNIFVVITLPGIQWQQGEINTRRKK